MNYYSNTQKKIGDRIYWTDKDGFPQSSIIKSYTTEELDGYTAQAYITEDYRVVLQDMCATRYELNEVFKRAKQRAANDLNAAERGVIEAGRALERARNEKAEVDSAIELFYQTFGEK